jgi:hypothetical protein
MKKIIVLITACAFSFTATMSQDNQKETKMQKQNDANVKYCATLKDGKISVTQNNKDLGMDVKLANGATVKTDGTIIKADGSQMVLKNGECADNSGNLINPIGSDKMKSDDYKMPPK